MGQIRLAGAPPRRGLDGRDVARADHRRVPFAMVLAGMVALLGAAPVSARWIKECKEEFVCGLVIVLVEQPDGVDKPVTMQECGPEEVCEDRWVPDSTGDDDQPRDRAWPLPDDNQRYPDSFDPHPSGPPAGAPGETPPAAPRGIRCPSDDDEGGGSDPIDLSSGSFWLEVEDLRVKGRGLDFVWTRKYSSHSNVVTRQGYGWDASYDVWLEPSGFDIRIHDGHQRDDIYYFQTNARDTWLNRETGRVLTRDSSTGEIKLAFESGGYWLFNPVRATSSPGRLKSIVDANGNSLQLRYDAANRLSSVVDALGRLITIGYNGEGFIESVTDFAGRSVRYAYYLEGDADGGAGDLKSVTSPAILGTPNGNDFPQGRAVTYTYSKGHADRELNHNLLTITDGRRNDPNDPTFGHGPWLTNVYGETAFGTATFDRVIRQVWGPDPSRDTICLHYDPLGEGTPFEPARRRVMVTDRVGNVSEFYFGRGHSESQRWSDLLRERRYTGRATPGHPTTPTENRPRNPLRQDDPQYFETHYAYNVQGLVKRIVNPNGTEVRNTYEADINPACEVRARGDLRVRERAPGAYIPAASTREEFEYAGSSRGCGCTAFASRHVDGRGSSTRFTHDARGNVTAVAHRIPSIVETFEYNAHGQLTAHVHPDNGSRHRRRDEFTYYAAGPMRGYRESEVLDATGLRLVTTFEYTPWGDVRSVQDPRGNRTSMIVNAVGETVRITSPPVSATAPTPVVTHIWHDANGNPTRVDVENRDADGVLRANAWLTTRREYGRLDELVRVVEEISETEHAITEFGHDANRQLTLARLPEAVAGRQPDQVIRRSFDERGLMFRETRGDGGPDAATTQLDYDRVGNIRAVHTGLEDGARVTRFVHDAARRLASVTDPMGNVWSYVHDRNGNVVAERLHGEMDDRPGSAANVLLSERTHVFDAMDRRASTSTRFVDLTTGEPLGAAGASEALAFFTYTDTSQIETVTDPGGGVTTFEYDGALRLVMTRDSLGNEEHREHDPVGNLVALTRVDRSTSGRPDATWTGTATYDNLDRRLTFTDPLRQTQAWRHDSAGNLATFIDERGNRTHHAHDGLGRLLLTRQELRAGGIGVGADVGAIETRQTWDASGRLTGQIDGEGNVTTYIHDGLDRLLTVEHADGTIESYEHDAHGDLVRTVDANGTIVTWRHDDAGRVVRRDAELAPIADQVFTWEEFRYDGASRVRQALNGAATVLRAYDSMGNVTRETLNGVVTTSRHDALGSPTEVSLPSGRRLVRTYDLLGRPASVADATGVLATFSWLGVDRIERIAHSTGISALHEYDADARPRSIIARDGAGALLAQLSIAHDPEDNVTYRADLRQGGLAMSGRHDSASRLERTDRHPAGAPGVTIRYDLDAAGNRRSVAGGPDAGAYEMSDWTPEPADRQVNQYTATPVGPRQHDANGNVVEYQARDGGSRRLRHDFANRLRYHHDPVLGESTQYYHDAFGRLVRKATWGGSSPGSEYYYYDDDRLVEVRDESGATIATFVHGQSSFDVISMRRFGVDHAFVQDDQLSTILATSVTGAVVERYQYDDYGRPHFLDAAGQERATSAIGARFLYAGLHHDPRSGLLHAGARWLDPDTGQFLTRDPLGNWADPAAFGHGRAYGGNNPTTWIDPVGLSAWSARNFARGMWNGLGTGLRNSTQGMWDTMAGLVMHPVDTARGLYDGVKGLVGALSRGDLMELAGSLAPELARLVVCWSDATDEQQGRMLGKVLGTYGPELLLSALGAGLAKLGATVLDKLGDLKRALKCSLAAGTLVVTAQGLVAIEGVQVGDELVVPAGAEAECADDLAVLTLELEPRGLQDEGPAQVTLAVAREECWAADDASASEGAGASPGGAHELLGGAYAGLARVTDWREGVLPAVEAGDRVMGTIRHGTVELVTVKLAGGEELVATPTQRVLSASRGGWVTAGRLRAGERLATRTGEVEVESVTRATAQGATVHDLDLQHGHAYYVTRAEVTCHNCDLGRGGGASRVVHHPSQRAARRAAEREAGMGRHGGREVLPDQPLRPGSQSPQGAPGSRTEVRSRDTGRTVHHDPYGHRDGGMPPHYGVEGPGMVGTTHHVYPTAHDPRTNR